MPTTANGQAARSGEFAKIAAGIRESHHRLFHLTGGIGISYRLDVEQDPKNPIFLFQKGLDGSLNIKWPEMRCRVEGPMSGYQVNKGGKLVDETRPVIRQGNYNFETKAGVGRDGNDLGQMVNYRHSFSAKLGFPLLMQFYVEMDQFYFPDEALDTEYWLPDALEQHPYELGDTEMVNGIACRVLRRRGLDTIWVAPERGYVICQREYHYGVGKPLRERVHNLDLKEVAPGVWIPLRQIKEHFDLAQPGKLLARLTLRVLQTNVGNLSNSDVRVALDEKIASIEDQISGRIYTPAAGKGNSFDFAVQRARETNLELASWRTPGTRMFLLLVSANLFLGIAIARLLHRCRSVRAGGAENAKQG